MKVFESGKQASVGKMSALGAVALSAALLTAALAPAAAHAEVNVTVGVNQPGVYGRVDFGNAPPPRVIYEQPVVIQPPPVYVPRRPIYLRVPPGYEANWGRYCSRYEACGQPVYFVRDEPRPPVYRRDDRWDHRHDRRDDRRDYRRDDRHDDHHDDHRGGPGPR